MRSRYSAFVLADDDYLLDSWHPLTSPEQLDLSDNPDWLQLQIISSHEDNEQARVHFRAFYHDGKQRKFLEEHSEFRKTNGRWLYLRGDTN
jgi:SEC-C motif-containing protein